MYSNAAKQIPDCPDILSELFIAHVRLDDFASQQLVAMKIYKLTSESRYYYFGVMSIVLKVLNFLLGSTLVTLMNCIH